MLKNALAMSVDPSPAPDAAFTPDNFEAMTEDQQIAFALQMSLAEGENMETETTPAPLAATVSSRHISLPKYYAIFVLRSVIIIVRDLVYDTKSGCYHVFIKQGGTTGADNMAEDMSDPDFLQGVLANLPGVDPNSQEIQSAMSQLTNKPDKPDDDKGAK